jgi:hypothetical protein
VVGVVSDDRCRSLSADRGKTWTGLLAATLAVAWGLAVPAPSEALFNAPSTTTIGRAPADAALADFNHDGVLDLAMVDAGASGARGGVIIMLGNGAGGFGGATSFDAGAQPSNIVAADLNRDGNVDLAVSTKSFPTALSIFLGNGAGGFTPGLSYANACTGDLHAADFNRDSNSDLLASCGFRGIIGAGSYDDELYLGLGTGALRAPTTIPGGDRSQAADFDGNGKLGFAVAQRSGVGDGSFGVAPGRGDGSFGPMALFPSPNGGTPGSVAITDANGDGWPDVVAFTIGGSFEVLMNNQAGGFSVGPSQYIGAAPSEHPQTADFEHRGIMDVVVAAHKRLTLLRGNGLGAFPTYDLGYAASALAVGDLNRDGYADLVTGDDSSGTLRVFLNHGAANSESGGGGASSDGQSYYLPPSYSSPPATTTTTPQKQCRNIKVLITKKQRYRDKRGRIRYRIVPKLKRQVYRDKRGKKRVRWVKQYRTKRVCS